MERKEGRQRTAAGPGLAPCMRTSHEAAARRHGKPLVSYITPMNGKGRSGKAMGHHLAFDFSMEGQKMRRTAVSANQAVSSSQRYGRQSQRSDSLRVVLNNVGV